MHLHCSQTTTHWLHFEHCLRTTCSVTGSISQEKIISFLPHSDGCSFNIMQLSHRCTVYNSDQITKHMHTFINKQKATQCVFFLLQLKLA